MTGPRPLTRRQQLQNAAFLDALRRTGNVYEATRSLGVHRSTYTKRRAKHPAFAREWDAALSQANATIVRNAIDGDPLPAKLSRVARINGRLQLRRPPPMTMTETAKPWFLDALSLTANGRLAAEVAGPSHSAFHQLRKRDPAFAREMAHAMATARLRLTIALLVRAGFEIDDDTWLRLGAPMEPD